LGHIKLTESLREEELKKIEEIKRAAEKTIQEKKEDFEKELSRLESTKAEELENEMKTLRKINLSLEKLKAKEKILKAEKALEERIFRLMPQALEKFVKDSKDVFDKLAAELPKTNYDDVYVNKKDAEKAAKLFSSAVIHQDSAISEGIRAVAENGLFEAENTLETRFQTAKDNIFREVLKQIYERVTKNTVS